eukprot:gene3869-15166_t
MVNGGASMAEEQEIDNEMLMNYVQHYRVIYDKSCKDFKIPLKKRNAWKETSQKLGIDIAEAQKRYNNIRTTFSKYAKRLKCVRSGSGRSDVPELRSDMEYLRWLEYLPGTTNFKRRTNDVINAMSEITEDSADDDEEETTKTDDELGILDAGMGQNKEIEEYAGASEERPIESQDIFSAGDEAGSTNEDHPQSIFLKSSLSSESQISPASAYESASQTPSPSPPGSDSASPSFAVASNSRKSVAASTNKRLSKLPVKVTKKAWSKEKKPISIVEMDREFLNTMHSMQKAMTDTASPEQESFDDDKHFCLSLLGPMRSLEPRYKSMAKLQIMKIFNDIKRKKNSQKKAHYQLVPGASNINYQMNEASMSQQYYRPSKQPQNFNMKTNAPGSYSQESYSD